MIQTRTDDMNLNDLHKPFPPSEIEWRVGSTNSEKTSGLALAYLTARHVMERLDEVVGPENWQTRYEFNAGTAVCYLSVRIAGEWVTKADGAGSTDVEAEKGQISDALKRAAVSWGIGRYLYNMNNVWVDIEAAGRSFRIKRDQYAKLEAALLKQFGSGMAQEASSEPVQAVSGPVSDTVAKKIFPTLQSDLRASTTTEQLDGAWGRWMPTVVNWSDKMQENADEILQEMRRYLAEHGGDARQAAREMLEGDLRAAVSMDDLKTRWEKMGDALLKLGKDDKLALARVKEEMKAAIQKMGGSMPDFDNLTHAQKIAGTP